MNNTKTQLSWCEKISNKPTFQYIKTHYILYIMLILPIAYYIIFHYMPMSGIIVAFKDFSIKKGIFGSPWCGFEIYERLFNTSLFLRAIRNTLVINVLGLVIGFPAPIILALLLNELRNGLFKKSMQTILYLPHFLSWVVIGGMAVQIFATESGIINNVLSTLGFEKIPFLSSNISWIGTYIGVGIWQSIGWGAIVYMSAMTGIDAEQYEAAEIDGCSRFKLMYKITLPNIAPTIIIMLILKIGAIASIGFEQPLMMSNSMVTDVSSVLSTYSYVVGIQQGHYNTATAIGLFQSIINFALLLSANQISKKITGSAIW